jgi:hypothetical protein
LTHPALSKTLSLSIVLGIVLLIAVSVFAFAGGNGAPNSSTTNVSGSVGTTSNGSSSGSSTTSSATSDVKACGVGTQVIKLNSTEYCAIDVANDTVIGSPGYSYFLNDSVTFEGVEFQTICPSIYQGCPGANSSASSVKLGAMSFIMAFPDNTNETESSVIADGYYAQILRTTLTQEREC